MLLRSSSTPVLGSLISSISDSPNHHLHHHQQPPEVVHHHPTNRHPQTTMPHSLNKVSFHQSSSQKFTFSCNSSPISPSVSELSLATRGSSSNGGFRRAQSEGNLEGLVNSSSNADEFPKRSTGSFLETIPSFSFHSSTNQYEDEESEAEELEEAEAEKCNFAFNGGMKNMYACTNMGLQKEIDENSQMHLARGLGISGLEINFSGDGTYGGNGGGGGYGCEGGHRDEKDLEEHYKRMVQENPGNPLCLRNYAELLYQKKQDLEGAEEYYSRAILVDPKDGEILAHYAKLVWELHHDEDKAMGYFERAVQAAPVVDSHVHAAYASFLWEIEDEDEDKTLNDPRVLPPLLQRGAMASATGNTT